MKERKIIKRRKRKTTRAIGKNKNLTFKQERFVHEYIKDYDGTRSAIAAGYGPKGAHVRSSEMLKKPEIKKEIEKLQKKIAEKCEITKEKILKDLELTRLKALEKNRFAPAHRCSELQGKSIALFTDKSLIGEDRENPFDAEKIKLLEEGLLQKLEMLAGRRKPRSVEPLMEEKPMIAFKKKRRLLHQVRKRSGVNIRKPSFAEPEPEEELDFNEPDFDADFYDSPKEEYCPMPNKNKKTSFADLGMDEAYFEKRMRDDDIFSD